MVYNVGRPHIPAGTGGLNAGDFKAYRTSRLEKGNMGGG